MVYYFLCFFHLRLFLCSMFECPRYALSVSTCPSIVHSSSGWMKSIREDARVAWGCPTWLHPAPSGHICLPVSYLRAYWLRLPDKGQCCPVLDRWGGRMEGAAVHTQPCRCDRACLFVCRGNTAFLIRLHRGHADVNMTWILMRCGPARLPSQGIHGCRCIACQRMGSTCVHSRYVTECLMNTSVGTVWKEYITVRVIHPLSPSGHAWTWCQQNCRFFFLYV